MADLPKLNLSDKLKGPQSRLSDAGKSLGQGLGNAGSAISTYLNGKVTNRLLNHPAFRLAIIAIIGVYIAVGAVVGWKVYATKTESTNIRRILTIYAFPAVLMPQDVITVQDYLNQLSYIRHFADKTKQPLPSDQDLRKQLLDQAIETRLLLRSLQQYHVKVTKSDIDAVYKNIADSNGGSDALKKLLQDLYGMNENDFRRVIRDQLLREKVKKEVLVQVDAKHILIRDQKKAQDVLNQVKQDPSKFDDLAKQYSEDTATRDKGGDLGYFGRGVMDKNFEDAAFKMKKGDVSQDLVQSQFGYHIIKIVDRKGFVDKTYDQFMADLKKGKKIWVVYK